MTKLPEPRYAIGEIVWSASMTLESEMLACPDCQDEKIWHVKTPAGGKFDVACPRCQGYGNYRPQASRWVPETRRLTIGSVRMDTHEDEPVSYMCEETGVGSGGIHRESSLFPTEKDAARAAEVRATSTDLPNQSMCEEQRRIAEHQILDVLRDEERSNRIRLSVLLQDVSRTVFNVECEPALSNAEIVSQLRRDLEEWNC